MHVFDVHFRRSPMFARAALQVRDQPKLFHNLLKVLESDIAAPKHGYVRKTVI